MGRKKHKKANNEDVERVEDTFNQHIEESKKKKKHSKETTVSQVENIDMENDMGESKKKKSRKSKDESQTECNKMELDSNSLKTKNKKRKHEKSSAVNSEIPPVIEVSVEDSEEVVTKKKKKSKKMKDESVDMNSACQILPVEYNEEQPNKKKKKKKKNPENEIDDAEVDKGLEEMPKKKKKHKHHENEEENSSTDMGCDKVKQKEKDKVIDIIDECNPSKKMKKKKHITSKLDSTAITNLNDDTSQGNQVGAMERNIETEQEAPDKQLGQWGTATLESSDRQQKFLRLLGGCKGPQSNSTFNGNAGKKLFGGKKQSGKGLFGSLGSRPQHANYAMTNDKAKDLEAKLMCQYNSALDLKFNQLKGGGLGYERPPEEGKTFYINSNVSKSTKLD